ncbi:MAG TPA: ribosome biogenesis factor YjgA [Zeimonas sp.]|nr:ribosome biogenesis factor YjgA [Zeimonas sp.]
MRFPDDKPSKTQRKREMHELQALGERLAALDDDEIARLPIDERLADALREARRIRSREARRRQLQFIGRLMRSVDDVDALRAALAEIRR